MAFGEDRTTGKHENEETRKPAGEKKGKNKPI
jgi:hypothetical protein